MKLLTRWSGVVAILATLGIAGGCASSAPGVDAPVRTNLPAAAAPNEPLDQMVIAFDGGKSREAIKGAMDETMTMYDLALTSDNYSRAGSSLVALQERDKDLGCSRCSAIDILNEMRISGPISGLTFADAAAVASTTLISLR